MSTAVVGQAAMFFDISLKTECHKKRLSSILPKSSIIFFLLLLMLYFKKNARILFTNKLTILFFVLFLKILA